MEVVARYLKNVAFEVSTRGHRVICDQPLVQDGGDAGMTPPEFLLGSLASCAGYYAAKYLQAHGLSAEGLSVRVFAEKAAAPARLSSFRVMISAPETADPKYQAGLLRAASHCLIHNTLVNPSQIHVSLDEFTELSERAGQLSHALAMEMPEAR
jgi:putative redox protein